jgi:two-component system, CitB family, response regulator DctR
MKSSKISVLLIEDDPMVQEINRQFVEKLDNFTVVGVADNGEAGLAKLRVQKPDLIMLDIFMPLLNGVETLRKIREEFAVDVIIVSAANDIHTISQMLQLGAVDYIIKPFTFERIKQSLENYHKFKNSLSQKPSVSQTELDNIRFGVNEKHHSLGEKGRISLPKGLNQITMRRISAFLQKRTTPASAEEVAENVGLARVTARRYLEYLVSVNEIKLQVQYGGIGRPVNRYVRLSDDDQKDQKEQ